MERSGTHRCSSIGGWTSPPSNTGPISGLGLTQLGAVCFVVGSVLYRPAFENKCAGVDAETSWNDSMNNGTIIYVVGSLFFLAESVLGLAAAVLKHDDEQSSSEDERDFMRHASEKAKQKAKRATVAMSSGRSLQTRLIKPINIPQSKGFQSKHV